MLVFYYPIRFMNVYYFSGNRKILMVSTSIHNMTYVITRSIFILDMTCSNLWISL